MIIEALADNGGNQSAASAQLGITRQTLHNKMKKYNL
ncbi:MAG: helix-turn-helix domain-containing protein [Duncaniella sp.]|nr:helix-turn-helix domain-containing protein [Muribaculum sp.]MCM1255433.1 helix-turn-helix domain-containing protein [Duncaniella sp.]